MLPILPMNGETIAKQSLVSDLPNDMIKLLFMKITADKDLCAFTLVCTTLFRMSKTAEIQPRIQRFKIACHFDKLIDEKSTQLILALDKRPLSRAEAVKAGIPGNYKSQQQLDTKDTFSAEESERELYELFLSRCEKLNISSNSDEFSLSTVTIFEKLSEKVKCMKLNGGMMSIKAQTVSANFCTRIFYGIVDTYAKQPLSMITPNSFKQQVAELKKLTPRYDIVNIEAALRMAIRTARNIPQLKQLAAHYLNATEPVIEELMKSLEREDTKNEGGMIDKTLLKEAAQKEARKLGLFFNQLNRPVLIEFAAIQSEALHKIID